MFLLRPLEKAVKKQNVFVPQYPGTNVFKEYHGVPCEDYLSKARDALHEFLTSSNDDFFSVRTLSGTKKIQSHLTVEVAGDKLKIEDPVGGFKHYIKPTKWGTDTVEKKRERFWFFDENTLSECDVVRLG